MSQGNGADCKMPYLCRSRARSLFCSCLLCVVVILVLFYATCPPIFMEYSAVGHTAGRKHRIDRAANCEIIDVAIIVGGQSSCTHAVLLIKSILLFRRNPIRFHFFVDDAAQYILSTLMSTWHLYGVEYNFYKIPKRPGIQDDIIHYLVEALPTSVEKVITLECTVLLSADVFHLWKVFRDMENRGSAFGLVRPVWLGGVYEFSSSVVLVHLNSVRVKKWAEASFNMSKLYRQDKALFYILSRGWSPDSHNTSSNPPCYKKQRVCVHSSVVPSDLKTIVEEYDGNILRQKWIDCQTGPTFDQNAIDYHAKTSVYAPPCTDFKREGNQERRTHPFYAGQLYSSSSSPSNDVTLLLHVTLDRLVTMLEPMCKHWEGPMSIAVFSNDSEVSLLLNLIQSSPTISSRYNIAYHIVYKEGAQMYYPINPLRVIALENAQTQHIFLNDMDFLPSYGLHSYLNEVVQDFDLSHTVLVVPAFETYEDPKQFTFPKDKSQLSRMVSENRVFQFHREVYIRGHAPTDYNKWLKTKDTYEIQWQPQYEPYLVARNNITPLDGRFVGRHFNKVSHTEELYYQRYKFYVVADGFILHLPHALSSDAKRQNENRRHRKCYDIRRNEWRGDMVAKYGNEPYLINVYKLWDELSSPYETSFL